MAVVAAGLLAELSCLAAEDGLAVGFAEEDEGEDDEEGVESGEDPEEPAPSNSLSDDAADNWANCRTKQGDEGGKGERLSSLVWLPAVTEDGK